ncbi:sulfotransferase 6B1-like [Terrapene carolina triunguis]|uniref:Sulfotransferase n=1 Tax=Terrapene triunguis TaxID=2587831 RepID=A0A674K848_9SAUR|nr:sulfotransferase 6B1-like [Terrapene carolina triunguis]XP_026505480.1 sulfotransferase 6B1-like [Terrapene carolina triunguis]XP_026505481.1 sulfotransferase 6B1-like [Terrapene carolina triunguis]
MDKSRKTVVEYLDKILADGEKRAPEDLLFSYKGILCPAAFCNPETLQVLDSFEARSDDVILAGYPKSGTNWVDQVLNDLEITAAKYTEEEINERINITNELSVFLRLEYGDPETFKRMKELPFRRIIITHLPPQVLPKSVFKSKAKILLVVRNPKDTAVSYFHFHNNMPPLPSFSSWDEYFTAFMHGKLSRGSYFDYLVEWNKHMDDENVMAITYEELKENLMLGLKNIADFFGFSLNEEEIQTVAEKSSFKAMKEKSSKTHGTFGKILFRKGIIGDWKNHFSEAQNKEMDRKFEECLAGTKLGEKIKYGLYCKA